MAVQRTGPGRLRRRLRAAGLRRRLILAFVLVAAVSAGSLAVASYLLVRQARLDGSLATSAVEARQDLNLAQALAESDASGFIQAYERRGTHALLIFPHGTRVASDPQLNPPIPSALQSLVRRGQLGYQRMTVSRQPYLVVAGQVPNSPAQLYVFFSEQSIERNLAQLRNSLAVAWVGVLLLAALIGRALARRTLEPVARASEAARLIAGGRLDTRLTASAADEFGVWAAAFNEMADALETKIVALSEAQARELRFTANVAHELRTPLTALVAEASLLKDQAGQLPDGARRPVELLIADVGRLKALVGELMEISRLDSGSEPVRLSLFDARAIMTALISASGWQNRVTVTGGPLMLTSDPRRVERILTNLIGNAVEHTDGDVVVQVGSDGAHACVQVTDAGPGIPAEHVTHVFERFYKADSARAGTGSGLGLAIALENARLLRGNISVSSDVARGSVFRLTIPLEPTGDVRER